MRAEQAKARTTTKIGTEMTGTRTTPSPARAAPLRRARRLILTLGVTLFALFLSGCDKGGGNANAITYQAFDATVPDDFVARAAPNGGISIRTPPGWETLDLESRNMVIHAASPGQLGGVVNVVSFQSRGAQLQAAAEATVRDLPRQIKPFKLISHDYILVAGLPAARLVYEGAIEGISRRWMAITLIKGDRNILVTFKATPENFDAVRPTFDQILASLQIK